MHRCPAMIVMPLLHLILGRPDVDALPPHLGIRRGYCDFADALRRAAPTPAAARAEARICDAYVYLAASLRFSFAPLFLILSRLAAWQNSVRANRRCGWSSLSAFIDVFRGAQGYTPAPYHQSS